MLALLLALVACDSALDDVDNDMLNASEEAAVGTHVERPDSDDDGLLDGFEVFCSLTDPADPDQDADGDDDGWEHLRGLDPTNAEDAGYADGRDMLPIADKLALRPDRAPPIAAPDLPLRRLALGHPTLLRPFDLYDLALQDKWILLTLVPPTDVDAMNTWLTGGAPPDGVPDGVRERVDAGDITLVWVAYEDDQRAPATVGAAADAARPATEARPHVLVLADNGFELWGHADRPTHQRWLLLNQSMLVRAIDNWQVIADTLQTTP